MTFAAAINEGIKLIKEFEGLELKAYPDPGTGGDPWTIGWGNTRYLDGSPVKKGQTITAPQADTLLLDMLRRDVVPALEAIPFWQEMSEKQQGALISFGWNLGWRFYGANGFATISARLKNKEWTKVPEALLLYRNPGTSVEAGLRRRREAEGRLWKEGMVKPSAPKPEQSLSMINVVEFYKGEPHQDSALDWLDKSLTTEQRTEFAKRWRQAPSAKPQNPLQVPYFSQRDNASGQGHRECFSSSCAMLAAFYGKVKGDDEYNLVRARFGDTTDSMAQVKALRHLGLNPRFVQNLTLAQLKAEIASGRPLATGWLHQGSYRSPSGGGHWSVVVGTQDKATVHHDPFGASDIVNGGYKSATGGKFVVYADQYWLPRWEVKGGDGWAMLIAP